MSSAAATAAAANAMNAANAAAMVHVAAMNAETTVPRRRPDRRSPAQLRPMACTLGLLARPDGSARFSLDGSSVLCAVYGPTNVRSRDEKLDRAHIQVLFEPVSGSSGTLERLHERIIRQVVDAIIITALHPRTSIRIIVQVLANDGSILATAINAVLLALLDAGVPMHSTCAAVSCIVNKNGTLLLDPVLLETKEAQSTHTIVFDMTTGDALAVNSTGLYGHEEFDACHELALMAVGSIHAFMRAAVERKLTNLQSPRE